MKLSSLPLRLFGLGIVWCATLSGLGGQSAKPVAQTPPMGWNSWDSYGLTITEEQFHANVLAQSEKLKSFGWTYSVIDEGWFLRNPLDRPHPEKLQYEIDSYGRYIPVPARFPSALTGSENTGFKELGRWVHAQGLQFGIHIVRGIPRVSVAQNLPVEGSAFHAQDVADQTDVCPWDPTNWGIKDNAAGQAWYDALLRQYASWGVDLLKVDCIADHPYKVAEIRQIRLAIEHSGRPMVLSLSPGPTSLTHAEEVASLAQMWRISDDIWDIWKSDDAFPRAVNSQFDAVAAWAKYVRPGNWPDADMLPIGELRPSPEIGPGARHTRLTFDEERTQLSLWSMARSPLILGANLTLLDAQTLSLLTNADLIRIDQHSLGALELERDGDLVIWKSDLPRGETAFAFFNRGDSVMPVDKLFSTLGYGKSAVHYRDVWSSHDEGKAKAYKASIPAHGCTVILVQQ